MIEIKDRVPAQPGRFKIIKEDGSYEYVTLERADEPVEEGSAINKALLEGIQTEMLEDSKQLVAEYTLEEDTAQIDIQGLDIVADGGVYDIVVAGHTNNSSQSIHMRINEDEVGPYYYGTSTGSYTTNRSYIDTGCGGESNSYDGFSTTTLYCNGNNAILWHTISNSIGGSNEGKGSIKFGMIQTHSNITSLQFLEAYRNSNLVAGTTVKIYKRR